MIKRLMTVYIALQLALAPVASAFASTCAAMPKQPASHETCAHHQASALHQNHQDSQNTHQNCHDSEQGKPSHSHDRCNCHCPASTAGIINTFVPRLTDAVTESFVVLAETQHSVSDTPLFKPPRA